MTATKYCPGPTSRKPPAAVSDGWLTCFRLRGSYSSSGQEQGEASGLPLQREQPQLTQHFQGLPQNSVLLGVLFKGMHVPFKSRFQKMSPHSLHPPCHWRVPSPSPGASWGQVSPQRTACRHAWVCSSGFGNCTLLPDFLVTGQACHSSPKTPNNSVAWF